MTVRRLVVAVAGVLAAGACGTAAESGDDPTLAGSTGAFPLTVENCGRSITFDAPPERVMAIGGEAGSLLWAAGGADRISTFAPLEGEPLGAAEADLAEPRQLPIPGSGDIALEAIVAEDPDLVVTFGLNLTTPEDLAAAGIPTLILGGYCDRVTGADDDATTPFDRIYADIALYGQVLGTEDAARDAVAELGDRVAAATGGVLDRAARSAVAVFVSDGESPLGAYGNRSTVHQQLSLLGLENALGDADERYFEPTVETLIQRAPEVLIALYQADAMTPEQVRAALTGRAELASVPALRDGSVLVLDFFYTGNGLLAFDGLERLAAQLEALP